jgi:hypothetical protein
MIRGGGFCFTEDAAGREEGTDSTVNDEKGGQKEIACIVLFLLSALVNLVVGWVSIMKIKRGDVRR